MGGVPSAAAGPRLSRPLRLPQVGGGAGDLVNRAGDLVNLNPGYACGAAARLHRCPLVQPASPSPRHPALLLQVASSEVLLASRAKRVYANAHTYHINSISVNSDQETFLSADDLRINLWHLEVTGQSFNVVDIKPANMEDLTEVRAQAACSAGTAQRRTGCARSSDNCSVR